MASIHALLPLISGEIGPIGKERKNEQQKYRFRGIEDILNAVNPILVKHGVTVIPKVLETTRETHPSKNSGTLHFTLLKVEYTFWAADGSSVAAVVVGEGMDSGDKSCNKALSAAFKYALGQVFSIPFDAIDSEDDDPRPEHRQAPPPAANGIERNGNNNLRLTAGQVQQVEDLLKRKGVSLERCLSRYQVNALADLSLHQYAEAMRSLASLKDYEPYRGPAGGDQGGEEYADEVIIE